MHNYTQIIIEDLRRHWLYKFWNLRRHFLERQAEEIKREEMASTLHDIANLSSSLVSFFTRSFVSFFYFILEHGVCPTSDGYFVSWFKHTTVTTGQRRLDTTKQEDQNKYQVVSFRLGRHYLIQYQFVVSGSHVKNANRNLLILTSESQSRKCFYTLSSLIECDKNCKQRLLEGEKNISPHLSGFDFKKQ